MPPMTSTTMKVPVRIRATTTRFMLLLPWSDAIGETRR
jgi:hypothetical protein